MIHMPCIAWVCVTSLPGKKQARHLSILACFFLLSALSACNQEEPVHQRRLLGFGTIIEITIYGTEHSHAQRVMDEIEEDFEFMHNAWSPNKRNALKRTNQLFSTSEWFSVAPSVRPLIIQSIELSKSSQHLFNPAIGKLIERWGFNEEERLITVPPSEQQISALVNKNPKMTDIEFKGITIRSRNPDVMLNFGAFAKGYAIDKNIALMKARNITNAIINAGGDLRAIGKHGNRPWKIGIRHPRKEGVIASLEIQNDESIFTSGDYERYFEHNGKRYHHIIDPRTGFPSTGTISVTVIHPNAATADAASTALFVAGKNSWHKIAKNMGIKYVMLIDEEGTVYLNPAMNDRIHFISKPLPKIILSEPL